MLRVEFEPTIPAFERAKTDRNLDREATVIGLKHVTQQIISMPKSRIVFMFVVLDRRNQNPQIYKNGRTTTPLPHTSSRRSV
jgi:hypothetical protein